MLQTVGGCGGKTLLAFTAAVHRSMSAPGEEVESAGDAAEGLPGGALDGDCKESRRGFFDTAASEAPAGGSVSMLWSISFARG